jgi:hypothetical protein
VSLDGIDRAMSPQGMWTHRELIRRDRSELLCHRDYRLLVKATEREVRQVKLNNREQMWQKLQSSACGAIQTCPLRTANCMSWIICRESRQSFWWEGKLLTSGRIVM